MYDAEEYTSMTPGYDEDAQPEEPEFDGEDDGETYSLDQHDGQLSTPEFDVSEAVERIGGGQ